MILNTFTIQTQDSILIARQKLIGKIDASPKLFEYPSNQVTLCGEVSESSFKLSRRRGARKYPLTTIRGKFEVVPIGTVIHLTVELNLLVIVPLLLFIVFGCSSEWQKMLKSSRDLDLLHSHTMDILFVGIAVVMPVIMIVASISSYQDELKFYRKKLTQIFLETT